MNVLQGVDFGFDLRCFVASMLHFTFASASVRDPRGPQSYYTYLMTYSGESLKLMLKVRPKRSLGSVSVRNASCRERIGMSPCLTSDQQSEPTRFSYTEM